MGSCVKKNGTNCNKGSFFTTVIKFYLRMKNAATPRPIPMTNKAIPTIASIGDLSWPPSGIIGTSAAVSEFSWAPKSRNVWNPASNSCTSAIGES